MREYEAKTIFVCNTITGGVYEVKKGFDIDEKCIKNILERVKARGEEYAVFMLPGVVKHDDIEKLANAISDWRRFQDARLPECMYGTPEAIEILTDGMEKPYGEA
nr:MAG TPA: hypothetical protein [Caudoviricetes sp.]